MVTDPPSFRFSAIGSALGSGFITSAAVVGVETDLASIDAIVSATRRGGVGEAGAFVVALVEVALAVAIGTVDTVGIGMVVVVAVVGSTAAMVESVATVAEAAGCGCIGTAAGRLAAAGTG